jgi:hypothetical protein
MKTNPHFILLSVIFFLISNAHANLIDNGDFESGITGYTTSYQYDSYPDWVTEYCLTTDPILSYPDSGGYSYNDHTSGSGYMMMVNGSSSLDVTVWQQSVLVQQNTDYVFSYYLSSWSQNYPAQLRSYINGSSIGSDAVASLTEGYWKPISYNWNSGNNTSAIIQLVDMDYHIGGNDFALDDINLSVVPVPGALVLGGLGAGIVGWLRRRKTI